MKPAVSIITPYLNAEAFISKLIENIKLQTFSNWELLLIDDDSSSTLAAASSREKVASNDKANKVDQAKLVGKLIADRAKEAGVSSVVFDRGGFLYHGRVKALADSAREAGLNF